MSYDYANARLRALRSELFDGQTYDAMLSLTRVQDLIAFLAESPYGGEIRSALARYVGVRAVMDACRLNLAHTFHPIRDWFHADGARLVGVLLARWDLINLKTILRGQEAGAPADEILQALVPAGDLDENALRALVRQPDPLATVDLLRTWNIEYARAARRALAEFLSTHAWSAFETALDRIFYERLIESLKPADPNDEMVRRVLAREIDAINVLSVLRLRALMLASAPGRSSPDGGNELQGVAELKRHLLPGGDLSESWLETLARASHADQALALLRDSKFGPALAGIPEPDPGKLQSALDRDRARFGIGFFARAPLSIATAIGYIAAKTAEVKNIRLIAHGLALSWGRAEIQEELVW